MADFEPNRSWEIDDSPRHGERRRLELAPRNEEKAKLKSTNSGKSSIFGDARPREEVLAARLGKDEKDILEQEAKQEKLKLRLTREQLEEKQEIENSIAELELLASSAPDERTRQPIQYQLQTRRMELEALESKFETLALETALSGGSGRGHGRRPGFHGPRGGRGRGRRSGSGSLDGYGDYDDAFRSPRRSGSMGSRGRMNRQGSGDPFMYEPSPYEVYSPHGANQGPYGDQDPFDYHGGHGHHFTQDARGPYYGAMKPRY